MLLDKGLVDLLSNYYPREDDQEEISVIKNSTFQDLLKTKRDSNTSLIFDDVIDHLKSVSKDRIMNYSSDLVPSFAIGIPLNIIAQSNFRHMQEMFIFVSAISKVWTAFLTFRVTQEFPETVKKRLSYQPILISDPSPQNYPDYQFYIEEIQRILVGFDFLSFTFLVAPYPNHIVPHAIDKSNITFFNALFGQLGRNDYKVIKSH